MHPHRKKANADHEAKLAKFAAGGHMTAGAESGVGRLQKAAHHRKVAAMGEGHAPKLRADQVARRARGGKVKKRAEGGPTNPATAEVPPPKQISSEEDEYNRELKLRIRNAGPNGRLPPTSR